MSLPLLPPLPSFASRQDLVELMDEEGADEALLLKTIGQFGLINALLGGTARRVIRRFFPLMEKGREYLLVDIGSGGCDIPLALVKEARRRGLRLRVIALDRDPRILDFARKAVRGYPEIEPRVGAASSLPELGEVDLVISNHLLHHLRREEIGGLLRAAASQARLGFLFDDLLRSPWSWLGYTVFASLFARGSFALDDGRLSILRGFRPEELAELRDEYLPGSAVEIFRGAPGRVGFALKRP